MCISAFRTLCKQKWTIRRNNYLVASLILIISIKKPQLVTDLLWKENCKNKINYYKYSVNLFFIRVKYF